MRKKLILLALLVGLTQGAWGDGFGGGSGSIENPYIISTTDHWNELASNVNAGNSYSGKFFEMAADIDAQGISVGTSNTSAARSAAACTR